MKTFFAKDFEITPGKEIAKELSILLSALKTTDGEKTVVFEKGRYYIDGENCEKHMLYITNTVGDAEFEKNETPHLGAVAFFFSDLKDVVFDGCGASFLIDGKLTNIAVENCENITLKNLELVHLHPDMHELKVTKKGAFFAEYEVDRDSSFELEGERLFFSGKGYTTCANRNAAAQTWIGLIREETPHKLSRVLNPLAHALSVKKVGERKIRVRYLSTSRFKLGDRYYIYDVRRSNAGIFINKSRRVRLENIKQRFNYSLALVAQDTEDITVKSVSFAPGEGDARKMASAADFVQLCMCRGEVSITDSFFDGAGDDLLNVHGVHFKVTEVFEKGIVVRFMHPQTHGFNPLRVGDTIAFIDVETLLQRGTAVIEKSELLNEYEISLSLDSTASAVKGSVVEDISACPSLNFFENTSERIITRGLLVTTRGKVNIENNRFAGTSMSGVLLSDDAKSWYESGMCCDVKIKNNVFEYCGETPILIKPENSRHDGAVHKNISIIKNTFVDYGDTCISASSAKNIFIAENRFLSGKKIKTKNCENVVVDGSKEKE